MGHNQLPKYSACATCRIIRLLTPIERRKAMVQVTLTSSQHLLPINMNGTRRKRFLTKSSLPAICCFRRSLWLGVVLTLCGWFFVRMLVVAVTTISGSATAPLGSSLPVHYDVLVVGSGPAGMTAALYLARSGWSVLLAGNLADSQLARARILDNLPGVAGSTGLQWLQDTRKQLEIYGGSGKQNANMITFAQPGLRVSRLQQLGPGVWGSEFGNPSLSVSTRSVVLATGSEPRRLRLDGEEDLWGKQVHSCAVCDGGAYGANDTVVVVGGGDAALDAVLLLRRTVRRVILVHRRTTFRATNQHNLRMVQEADNVELHAPYVLSKYIMAQGGMIAVEMKNNSSVTTERIACDGVFLLLGATPNTDFARSVVQPDRDGYLLPHDYHSRGIFVAGDVADRLYHQAITAAGSGAQAALDAEPWLRMHDSPVSKTKSPIPLQVITRTRVEVARDQPTVIVAASQDKDPSGCDMTTKDCLQAIVNSHPVVVFSKPWCPYCRKALGALKAENVQPHVIDLTMPEAQQIQRILATISDGRRTVPNVFIGGRSIGGGDETMTLHNSGSLKILLRDAQAPLLEEA